MNEGSFSREIADHLDLKSRNRHLEQSMPIDHYREVRSAGRDSADSETDVQTVSSVLARDPESWWNAKGPVESAFDWGE